MNYSYIIPPPTPAGFKEGQYILSDAYPGSLAAACLPAHHSSRKRQGSLRIVGPGAPLVPGLTPGAGQRLYTPLP